MNLQELEKKYDELGKKIDRLKKGNRSFSKGEQYWYMDEDGYVIQDTWDDFDSDYKRLGIKNVFCTEQEAEEELLRRESMAKAWWPEEGETHWIWNFRLSEPEVSNDSLFGLFIPMVYIGAAHPTKEACVEWGKTYSKLFTKKNV